MYENNLTYVWDGETISEDFATEMGVKQGCVLSTLLFILFINDIVEAVGGGIDFGRTRVPCLVFADDIVFLAESIEGMQRMINRLENYCDLWNLSVNLEKSKMMIFRDGGGRYSRSEKWSYKGQNVTITREYKYLGLLVTPNLNMKKHFQLKLSEAKRAISAVWRRCIDNKYVDHNAKIKLFRATAASILLYGAQVWGNSKYEEVESFLRYFIKRIFRLPTNTPNYMLHVETTVPPLFLDVLKLHFDYALKVMEMEEGRLPKLVLKRIIQTKGNLARKWEELGAEFGVNVLVHADINASDLRCCFQNILKGASRSMFDACMLEAQSSQHRMIYSQLNLNLQENTYFLNRFPLNMISVIFKIRGELLKLNYIPHRPELSILCDLCNLREREDVFHFIGRCPVLREFRVRHFGRTLIDMNEVLSILNGDLGWEVLYNYTVTALRYRTRIIEGDF